MMASAQLRIDASTALLTSFQAFFVHIREFEWKLPFEQQETTYLMDKLVIQNGCEQIAIMHYAQIHWEADWLIAYYRNRNEHINCMRTSSCLFGTPDKLFEYFSTGDKIITSSG